MVWYLSGVGKITSSIFSLNQAIGKNVVYGGGIDSYTASLQIQNSSLTYNQVLCALALTGGRNTAVLRGGGISHDGSLLNMSSTLVAWNSGQGQNSSSAVPNEVYGAGTACQCTCL